MLLHVTDARSSSLPLTPESCDQGPMARGPHPPETRERTEQRAMAITLHESHDFPRRISTGPISVVVIDGHPRVRAGVADVLATAGGFDLVGQAAGWCEGLELVHEVEPDVVLLDTSAVAAVSLLRGLPCAPAVVLFTALADLGGLRAAKAAGASGQVSKDAPPADLVAALRRATTTRPAVRLAQPSDEADLVRLAVDGDPDAWEQLYRASYPRLLAFARRRVSADHAADAVAETFLRALTDLHRFDRQLGGFQPWLFGIARHVVNDMHRKQTRQQRLARCGEPAIDLSSEPLDAVLDGEEAVAARRAFAQLSDEDRQLLELRVIDGLSAEEAAAVLGKHAGSLRMAQSRAMARLRAALDEGDMERTARAR
jgi:RNA polymerase sigma-70 factor (ECF subfamily)